MQSLRPNACGVCKSDYLTDALTRIVNSHPNRDFDQLLPWAYRKQELKAVAWEQRLRCFRCSAFRSFWTGRSKAVMATRRP